MASSLYSALSGLQANQGWIDVIGNNLANSNTPGFKTAQASFADRFSRTLQFATAPGSNSGGKNPMQIGMGVRLSGTERDFAQGGLTNTGRVFDVALQGNGFFAVSNGQANLYARSGSFGLDGLHNLVDQRTGFKVLSPSGQPITVDTEALLPPSATSLAKLSGNLPKEVDGPLPEVLTGGTALKHGTQATMTSTNTTSFTIPAGETWTMRISVSGGAPQTVSVTSVTGTVTAAQIASAIDGLNGVGASVNGSGAIVVTSDRTGEDATLKITPGASGMDLAALTGLSTSLIAGTESDLTPTTTLNDLPGNISDYSDGDEIHISGVDVDGTPINAVFTYGSANDGTTVDDFIAFADAQFDGATVSLDSSGKIVLTADTAGVTSLQMSVLDDASATGRTDWPDYALSVTTQGTGPDKVSTALEVFDAAGVAHTIALQFERQEDLSWTLTPTMAASEGTILSSPITGISFGDDGAPTGVSSLDGTITVSFAGQSSSQDVELDLGQDGTFTGLTQFGGDGEVMVREQDGYGVGELSSMSVDSDGTIQGLYSNGKTQELGAIGIATFGNPEGLLAVGNNLFAQSQNSGSFTLGAGDSGSAGQVIGGALENSNVDTAEQFVFLIQAQRGFQANARVISAQNEVLRDMVNLI